MPEFDSSPMTIAELQEVKRHTQPQPVDSTGMTAEADGFFSFSEACHDTTPALRPLVIMAYPVAYM